MYRKQHNGQLSIEEFRLPFGGTLDTENRWVLLSALVCVQGSGQRVANISPAEPLTAA
jgi:hypothetical protein